MQVFDDGVVLMCDSAVPGRDDGELDEETYGWIGTTLDALDDGLPAPLAFHHPAGAPAPPSPAALRAWEVPPARPPPVAVPRPAGPPSARRPEIAGLIAGHPTPPAGTTIAGRPPAVGPG
ncbi:hypothetical protein [Streptomyces sp. NPDC012466]|uniref:hypothetical protein n=1 Tax=Streptomyces sp. NPDC012466 TaxID=3364835 RepID=UPI0036ED7475